MKHPCPHGEGSPNVFTIFLTPDIDKNNCVEKIVCSELRGCVQVEVNVLGPPSLIVLVVFVGVKQHFDNNTGFRAQELCESRGGRPGLPSLINLRFLWT